MRKQGKRNWFDIATTLWAITLVIVAVTWVATPVFAGGGPNCIGVCVEEGLWEDEGGCKTAEYEGGQCGGDCRDGGEWTCPMGV